MSIRRGSRSNGLTVVCDECGTEHPSYTDDFHDALDDFKEDGGVVRLDDGTWMHYCEGCD